MKRTRALMPLMGVTLVLLGVGVTADQRQAQGDLVLDSQWWHGGRFSAFLQPEQEVPSVSSEARGFIRLDIDEGAQEIKYELSYSGLESAITQAHIHFAQPGVNGGIVVWLCEGTSQSPIPTTPACPADGGNVSGTIVPADVVAITGANEGQQIDAGEFDEVVTLIRKGLGYANVHTAESPGGEIRGQIRRGFGHR